MNEKAGHIHVCTMYWKIACIGLRQQEHVVNLEHPSLSVCGVPVYERTLITTQVRRKGSKQPNERPASRTRLIESVAEGQSSTSLISIYWTINSVFARLWRKNEAR